MPNSKRRRSKEAGFTLTEILVVVLIIGLLSSVVLFNVLGSRVTAQVTKAGSDVSRLSQAVEQYALQLNSLPTQDQGLQALIERPAGLAESALYPRGGFIQNLPLDPWGRPYQYVVPAERSRADYDIFSFGADGLPGGEEENADIGNWDEGA